MTKPFLTRASIAQPQDAFLLPAIARQRLRQILTQGAVLSIPQAGAVSLPLRTRDVHIEIAVGRETSVRWSDGTVDELTPLVVTIDAADRSSEPSGESRVVADVSVGRLAYCGDSSDPDRASPFGDMCSGVFLHAISARPNMLLVDLAIALRFADWSELVIHTAFFAELLGVVESRDAIHLSDDFDPLKHLAWEPL
ncbi:MAG: hypothetical protein MUF00_20565 [Gemmatimonadaceae bacterium]|jgi:hypothetical protein|nr:hypothetical protein [Gemmatimonadaceae bacterium]